MQYNSYEAFKYGNGEAQKINDLIVIEGALQININGTPYTVVMRTPGNDFDLIRGLLYAEDIYKKKLTPKFTIEETNDNGFSIINVEIPKENIGKGYLNKRTLLSVSSCGICGKQDLDAIKITGNKIKSDLNLQDLKLKDKFEQFQRHQYLFKQTGGSHAAAIFDSDHNLRVLAEDIGRHNAVDKVVGELLNKNVKLNDSILLVSGRVSYEIISKAFIAKIPVVIAVSACSSLAIDYAKELGIKLIGFSRENNCTIYS